MAKAKAKPETEEAQDEATEPTRTGVTISGHQLALDLSKAEAYSPELAATAQQYLAIADSSDRLAKRIKSLAGHHARMKP